MNESKTPRVDSYCHQGTGFNWVKLLTEAQKIELELQRLKEAGEKSISEVKVTLKSLQIVHKNGEIDYSLQIKSLDRAVEYWQSLNSTQQPVKEI